MILYFFYLCQGWSRATAPFPSPPGSCMSGTDVPRFNRYVGCFDFSLTLHILRLLGRLLRGGGGGTATPPFATLNTPRFLYTLQTLLVLFKIGHMVRPPTFFWIFMCHGGLSFWNIDLSSSPPPPTVIPCLSLARRRLFLSQREESLVGNPWLCRLYNRKFAWIPETSIKYSECPDVPQEPS